MHPYRLPPEPPEAPARRALLPEEHALVALLIVIGAVGALPGPCAGRSLDVESTAGLAMLVAGAWWGLRGFR
ncbi:MAG TPA: hypothetical protein VGF94_07615 [Kofleriaceae bacterium]|jgi:hypothetical protein